MPGRLIVNCHAPGGSLKTGERLPEALAAASSRAKETAARKAPHLQSVIRVAGGGTRIGVLPANLHYPIRRSAMSLIDKALKANERYAKKHDRKLGAHPTPKIAVVTCMDPRLSDLPKNTGAAASRSRRYPDRRSGGN